MEIVLWVLPGFVTYLLIVSSSSNSPIQDSSDYILLPIFSIYSIMSVIAGLLGTKIPALIGASSGNFFSQVVIKSKLGHLNVAGVILGLLSIYFLKFFTVPLEVVTPKDSLTKFLLEIYNEQKYLCMIRTKHGRVYIGHVSKREENRYKDDHLFIVPVLTGRYNNDGVLDIKTAYTTISPIGFSKSDEGISIENGIAVNDISSVTNFSFRRFVKFYYDGSIMISNKDLKTSLDNLTV